MNGRRGDLAATVLAVRGEHTYLIKLDPPQPRSPQEHPRLKMALDAKVLSWCNWRRIRPMCRSPLRLTAHVSSCSNQSGAGHVTSGVNPSGN